MNTTIYAGLLLLAITACQSSQTDTEPLVKSQPLKENPMQESLLKNYKGYPVVF